jgi:hypothetical protein
LTPGSLKRWRNANRESSLRRVVRVPSLTVHAPTLVRSPAPRRNPRHRLSTTRASTTARA